MKWLNSEFWPLLILSTMHEDNLRSTQPDLRMSISLSISNLPSKAAIIVAALSGHTNNVDEDVVDSIQNSFSF